MQITVEPVIQVPSRLFFYDVGANTIECNACGKFKAWEIEGDRVTSSAPPFHAFTTEFVKQHKDCVIARAGVK